MPGNARPRPPRPQVAKAVLRLGGQNLEAVLTVCKEWRAAASGLVAELRPLVRTRCEACLRL